MSPTADQLVDDYLKRLNAELAELPRARRREVVQEISEHISEARSDLETQSEAEIRTLLERVGDPANIGVEARERFGVQPRKPGWLEVAALVLLPIGGFVLPIVGWFVGVALLWASNAWSTRDKLVGTFVVPGGLVLPLGLGVIALSSSQTCVSRVDPGTDVVTATCTGASSDGIQVLGLTLLVVLILAPLVTTVYLARRMRRGSAAAAV